MNMEGTDGPGNLIPTDLSRVWILEASRKGLKITVVPTVAHGCSNKLSPAVSDRYLKQTPKGDVNNQFEEVIVYTSSSAVRKQVHAELTDDCN